MIRGLAVSRRGQGVGIVFGQNSIHGRDEFRTGEGNVPRSFLVPAHREVGTGPGGVFICGDRAHGGADAVSVIRFQLPIEHAKHPV